MMVMKNRKNKYARESDKKYTSGDKNTTEKQRKEDWDARQSIIVSYQEDRDSAEYRKEKRKARKDTKEHGHYDSMKDEAPSRAKKKKRVAKEQAFSDSKQTPWVKEGRKKAKAKKKAAKKKPDIKGSMSDIY